MQPSEKLKNFVKEVEGCVLEAYVCPGGKLTVGYGHTGDDVHKGMSITQAQAEVFLENDLQNCVACIEEVVKVPITQGQFDALCSFVYNFGCGKLKTSTLLRKLNASDYTGAAEQFHRWVHSKGKKLPSLVKRRQRELTEFWMTPDLITNDAPKTDINAMYPPETVRPGEDTERYEALRDKLDVGTVLFWRDDSIISKLIRLRTAGLGYRESFSHVSLVARSKGRVLTVEALARGVVPTYLSNRLGEYGGEVWGMTLKLNAEQKQCLEIFAEKSCCENEGYDFKSLFANLLGPVSLNAERYFCSEFVQHALVMCAGLPAPDRALRPGDMVGWLTHARASGPFRVL